MIKKELRSIYKSKRAQLGPDRINELSTQIANNLFREFEPVPVTHLFISIDRLREINTAPIVDRLHSENLVTCTGITQIKSGTMRSVAFTQEIEFQVSPFGIPEPIGGPAINDKDIDRVLIPLLAFDQNGNRVGYGKGFYDRFLANCRPDVEKIGLSLFGPCESISDVTANDVPLDYCVTPEHVFRF